MYVVFVTVNVRADCEDAFLTATRDNHKNSVKEPGCKRFDVIRDAAIPTRFYLYEVYESIEANVAHKETEHYRRWAATVESMMELERQSLKGIGLLPSPWK